MTTSNAAASAAHGSTPVTGNVIARIEEQIKDKKTSLMTELTTLSTREDELEKSCKEEAFELYGVKKAKKKKTYEAAFWLWLTFFVVACADIPLNYKGFEVLRMNSWLTWICTIGTALGLAFLSKFSGKFFKRAEVESRIMSAVFAVATFGGGVAIIWQVAQLRYTYLLTMHKATWDTQGQVTLAGAVFLVAVAVSWYFTSDTKNIKREELHIAELAELEQVKHRMKAINKELGGLTAEKNKLIDKAEKDAASQHDKHVKSQIKLTEANTKLADKNEKLAKKEEEKRTDAHNEQVKHDTVLAEIKNEKSPKQINFEKGLGDFKTLLTSAQDKAKHHEGETGDQVRHLMVDDIKDLEAHYEALELLSALWPAGVGEFNDVTVLFTNFKTEINEKA